VDLQEKRQLDVAAQMTRVKARARPWRAIIAGLLAIACGILSWHAGQHFTEYFGSGPLASKVVAATAAAATCLFGVVAVLDFGGRTRDVLRPVTGLSHAAIVRYAIVLLGILVVVSVTLALLKLPISQLLVGGAITSIILGIAAQQALGNVFAGIVLLLSRPFVVGDAVRFRAGAFSGQIEGTVTEIGITYLRLDTAEGVLHLPNSQVLAAVVGLARQVQGELAGAPGPASPPGPPLPPGSASASGAPPGGTAVPPQPPG
jgi:small-conductance mechanosensitive channel